MQLELVFTWCYLINQRFAKYSNVNAGSNRCENGSYFTTTEKMADMRNHLNSCEL